MKKKLILSLLVAEFLLGYVQGQEKWTEIDRKQFSQPITSFSIDTEQSIYLGFLDGKLRKFDKNGKELPSFSLPNQSSISLIEAQNNRKVFLFQKDIQKITILDRFTTIPQQYDLQDFDIEYATSACPAPDGSVWTVENNPQVLKRIDLLRNTLVHEVQHSLGDSIFFMRANKNLLFILDENGLQTLDQYGNKSNLAILERPTYLQTSFKEILVSHNKGLSKINTFNASIQEEMPSPPGAVQGILVLTGKYAIIRERSYSFYLYNPE